jgi:hypothetical protein
MSKHTSSTSATTTDPLAVVAAERAKRAKAPKAPRTPTPATPEATTTPEAPATPRPLFRPNGAPYAVGLPCLCGCGAATHTPKAAFLSGHDAKLRKRVLRMGESLPAVVLPFFEAGANIAGMLLVAGEIVDTKPQIENAIAVAQSAA